MADAIPPNTSWPESDPQEPLQVVGTATGQDPVLNTAVGSELDAAEPPDALAADLLPAPQLPVADLIGLRFSLQHLRLVGYGLLAAWLAELINLLSSPGLLEIAARLQSISQLLDLSPILLVGIGLVSFQGGLRRSAIERICLPVLLAMLPLLSAFHFFLAPVSVANVVTLVQKQQQIGRDQLERIDRQIDRAGQILAESDSIDALLDGLQRIPGLQVRVPANAEVAEARQQVRGSLQKERDRIRERIKTNLANSRNAFLRRAGINTALAVLMGLLLWGLHRGAMAEMEQSIPYLDWVLAGAASVDNPLALVQLIDFQRSCVALGWFTLLERSVRFVRRRLGLAEVVEEALEQEQDSKTAAWPPPPMAPPTGASAWGSLQQRLKPMLPSGLPVLPEVEPGSEDAGNGDAVEAADLQPNRGQEAWLKKQLRRQQRDLERYRRQAQRLDESEELRLLREGHERELRELDELRSQPPTARGLGRLLAGWLGSGRPDALPPGEEQRQERSKPSIDPKLYVQHPDRINDDEYLQLLQEGNEDLLREFDELRSQPPPPPRGLRRLVHWFLTHL